MKPTTAIYPNVPRLEAMAATWHLVHATHVQVGGRRVALTDWIEGQPPSDGLWLVRMLVDGVSRIGFKRYADNTTTCSGLFILAQHAINDGNLRLVRPNRLVDAYRGLAEPFDAPAPKVKPKHETNHLRAAMRGLMRLPHKFDSSETQVRGKAHFAYLKSFTEEERQLVTAEAMRQQRSPFCEPWRKTQEIRNFDYAVEVFGLDIIDAVFPDEVLP